MKLTINNYTEATKNIDFKKLSESAQEAHKGFTDFADFYNDDKDIKEMLDNHFDEVESYLKKGASKTTVSNDCNDDEKASKPKKRKKKASKTKEKKQAKSKKPNAHKIEKVHEEIKFIKRYLLLNNKDKTKKQILLFINALQRAISERRIRKTSKYANEINHIQEQLVGLYNRMNEATRIELETKIFEKYYAIAYSEAVMPEISIIKQYIGLNGKANVKERAKRLLVKITNYIVKDKITENSKYFSKIKTIKKSLESYVIGETDKIKIHKAELNGLQGITNSNAQKKKEIKRGYTPNEILAMSFDMLGLSGKWKRLFGDVPHLFYFMIWGGAGSGKSTMAIEFAYYLTEKLNKKVCYVAEEQKISFSLQSIIKRLGLKGDSLIFEPNLGTDYSDFDIVFIDSITTLGLTGKDLEKLIKNFPNTSFVFLLQSTKGSKNFRGGNDILHLLDTNVVVERQDLDSSIARIDDKNRFGGKGEIEVEFG